MLLQAADRARARAALRNELLDAGFADADQSKFCGNEKAVGENQHRNRDEPEEQQA